MYKKTQKLLDSPLAFVAVRTGTGYWRAAETCGLPQPHTRREPPGYGPQHQILWVGVSGRKSPALGQGVYAREQASQLCPSKRYCLNLLAALFTPVYSLHPSLLFTPAYSLHPSLLTPPLPTLPTPATLSTSAHSPHLCLLYLHPYFLSPPLPTLSLHPCSFSPLNNPPQV